MSTKFLYKVLGSIVGATIIVGLAQHYNLVPGAVRQKSDVPVRVDLPSAETVQAPESAAVGAVGLPTSKIAPVKQPQIRWNAWQWNAQFGALFANGGSLTTVGSLMEKHEVSMKVVNQDDTELSKGDQVKFATALAAGNSNPQEGIHYVTIMGDGAAQYMASINKLLEKLGPEYQAEIVGALGFSRGEDGWWGPQEWADSKEAMKGGATAGVLRDGDWNITLYKLNNDGIKNNPDPTTWDPDAMNWFAAETYLTAVEMYVAGHCEDRPVVRNGKLTNEPKHRTCVDAVTTWTPGDVNIAKNKGGLVRLFSTKENIWQMPCVVIGIKKWDVTHAKLVQEMLAAMFEGGDQVRHYEAAKNRAGAISASVYNSQTAAYWVKYFNGVMETDKVGVRVPLGGSSVMNLADNLYLFGLTEGSGGVDNSLFKASYEGFGNLVKQQYPKLVPNFPKTAEAVNTSFISALAAAETVKSEPDVPKFEEAATPIASTNVVAKRDWSIQFDTGKSTFTPAAESTLNDLYTQLNTNALTIEIDGHTDNVGSADANKALSEARAFAVKTWLQSKAPKLFPDNRIAVRSFGDTNPITSNATPEGRAKNRRVTIVLGTR